MPIPKPKKGEHENEFLQRCILDEKMKSEYKIDQRITICKDSFNTKLATEKVSFDYDGTLSTSKGTLLARNYLDRGVDVYIISARDNKEGMINKAKQLGIPNSRVYATGSNENKIQKILDINITIHYDNNKDVIKQLKGIGKLI